MDSWRKWKAGADPVKMDEDKGIELLAALGIEVIDVRYDELLALCPKHKERTGKVDHNPSWSFNPELGLHHCLSCGYSGNTVGLIVDMLDLRNRWDAPDYDAAEEWLKAFGLDLPTIIKRLAGVKDRLTTYEGPAPTAIPMTESRLALFTDPPDWALAKRGIDLASAQHYGVLWDDEAQTWILPFRGDDHKLWGWQAKGEGNKTFLNRPLGIKKSQTFFGWAAVQEGGTIVVVESPLDAVLVYRLTGLTAVAVCGSKLSDKQIEMLRGAEEIILAMDNDKAGKNALRHFYTQARKYGINFRQYAYGDSDGKDPGDQKDSEVLRGIKGAVHSVHGLKRLLEA